LFVVVGCVYGRGESGGGFLSFFLLCFNRIHRMSINSHHNTPPPLHPPKTPSNQPTCRCSCTRSSTPCPRRARSSTCA
jgi:hypothetical protein